MGGGTLRPRVSKVQMFSLATYLALESLIHVSNFVLYWCLVPDEFHLCH